MLAAALFSFSKHRKADMKIRLNQHVSGVDFSHDVNAELTEADFDKGALQRLVDGGLAEIVDDGSKRAAAKKAKA